MSEATGTSGTKTYLRLLGYVARYWFPFLIAVFGLLLHSLAEIAFIDLLRYITDTVAVLTGIIISAPFWLYQLWAFIAPGLHKKERRNSIFFIIAATPFFSAGAFLGYAILPAAVKVLFGFTPDALNNLV